MFECVYVCAVMFVFMFLFHLLYLLTAASSMKINKDEYIVKVVVVVVERTD